MQRLYEYLARAYFLVATASLMLIGVLLLLSAVWQIFATIATADRVNAAFDSVGLLIIGFAVVETAKFIAEEELWRQRELRSSLESRRSLTKFTTIIVIAISLEALVMIFKTSRSSLTEAVYPALLFMAAMFALVALGIYQWLSSRIEPPSADDKHEAEPKV